MRIPNIGGYSESSQAPEEAADILGQQAGLLHRREVPAPRHVGPVSDVVHALDPRAGREGRLEREARDAAGNVDSLAGAEAEGSLRRFEVEPDRGTDRLRGPVNHY